MMCLCLCVCEISSQNKLFHVKRSITCEEAQCIRYALFLYFV